MYSVSTADKPAASKPDVRAELRHLEGLPASARIIQSALEATLNPLTTNDHLQEILSQDAGAAADVLRLANSAYFGVRLEVKSLRTAAAIVGLRRLRTLLRHLLVNRLYSAMGSRRANVEPLRQRAFAAGVLARQIATQKVGLDPDDLQIGGLIHNIGELALASVLPSHYAEWQKAATTAGSQAAFDEVFGIAPEQVSRWLLESWQFPWLYVEIGAHGGDPDNPQITPPSRECVDIAHLGIRLGGGWLAKLSFADALNEISPGALRRVGLDHGVLEEIYAQTDDYVAELRAIL